MRKGQENVQKKKKGIERTGWQKKNEKDLLSEDFQMKKITLQTITVKINHYKSSYNIVDCGCCCIKFLCSFSAV